MHMRGTIRARGMHVHAGCFRYTYRSFSGQRRVYGFMCTTRECARRECAKCKFVGASSSLSRRSFLWPALPTRGLSLCCVCRGVNTTTPFMIECVVRVKKAACKKNKKTQPDQTLDPTHPNFGGNNFTLGGTTSCGFVGVRDAASVQGASGADTTHCKR